MRSLVVLLSALVWLCIVSTAEGMCIPGEILTRTIQNRFVTQEISAAEADGWTLTNQTKVRSLVTLTFACLEPTLPPPPPPPPPTGDRGPQATILCAVGAVGIWPGSNIQSVVNANLAGTAFCLMAGIHWISYETTPKTGDSFTGEYGAILDGTGWVRDGYDQAAIKAFGVDVDNVIIRNIECRNMPRNCFEAYNPGVITGWVVDHTLAHHNYRSAVNNLGDSAVVSNNIFHHNIGNTNSQIHAENGGAFIFAYQANVLFVNNEVYANGPEMKVSNSPNVMIRGNYFHNNTFSGIWVDGDNRGCVIEDNLVEDEPIFGIFIEITQRCVARNNIVRRSGWGGIELHTSREIEVYGNSIEYAGSTGIQLRMECHRGSEIVNDLTNNSIHDNVVRWAGSNFATGLIVDESIAACASRDAYFANQKNNQWDRNTYQVPLGRWWLWGTLKDWSGWQAIPQDVNGTVTQP